MEERKTTEAQRNASRKYNDTKTVGFSLRLNKATDADIIERLEQTANRQGYIKSLIRSDMKKDS